MYPNLVFGSQTGLRIIPSSNSAYLTSWRIASTDVSILEKTKQDLFLLAFAKWDQKGEISASNNLLTPSLGPNGELSQAYRTWTQFAYQHPDKKFVLSFGGQEYENIWKVLNDSELISQIADNLVVVLNRKFPVYRQNDQGTTQIIGEIELSGIDFDFEQSSRLSRIQNQGLLNLARELRKKLRDEKLILLTTYHVGADPIACLSDSRKSECSYRSDQPSVHHGEVLPLLQSSANVFDAINIMAYDAGEEFDYQKAVQNYANAVGSRDRLRLGFTINKQWSPNGGFVMSDEEIYRRNCWSKKFGLGGVFAWALGANTENIPLEDQVAKLNSLTRCWHDSDKLKAKLMD